MYNITCPLVKFVSWARRDLRILRRPDNGGKSSDAPVDKQSIKLFSTTSFTCKSTSLKILMIEVYFYTVMFYK